MKAINLTIIAVVIAAAGTWSRKKQVSMPMIVGGTVVSLGIVVLDEMSPELARNFALLMLAAAMGAYGEDLFTMVGNLTTGNQLPDPNRPEQGKSERPAF